ncbi:VWA domain-containing protein [Oceanobacillus damuensis]|uniref:VWA domain-containing protein n=1 Tax=Oceanobacillus damuensis TaxID=937928 RepID=UPI000829664E|nr:VWA domain-containing protein [Oceanobacillus damuensis]
MVKNRYLFFQLVLLFLLVSCSNTDGEQTQVEEAEDQNQETEVEDVEDKLVPTTNSEKTTKQELSLGNLDPIPTDEVGLATQLPGPYGGYQPSFKGDHEEELREYFEQIEPMSENPSDEEYEAYLRYMYWLVAADYPDPQDVIKKWEFGSFGNPDLPDSRLHFKENYNIEILLDSSGSMGFYAGDKTRMQVAKEAINEFVKNTPEEANVSLRVYGHEGTGDDADKALSCATIEQVYGFAPYNESDFQAALNLFEPAGWTPLAAAMEASNEAMKDLNSEENTNLIYIVSDGIETCDGDPVKVAEQLAASNAKPIINVIGFQTDAESQEQLQKIAEVAEGIYASARNQDELQAEFERAEEVLDVWEQWKKEALRNVDAAETKSTFDIMEMSNDWSFITTATSNNMNSLAPLLEDFGIITFDQRKELIKRYKELREEMEQTVKELEESLEELSTETLEQTKDEINQKYNSNVQD